MDKKEERRTRYFIIKACFLLVVLLVLVGFLPHARVEGGMVYEPKASGVMVGETFVAPAGSIVIPLIISETALALARGGDSATLYSDITSAFAPQHIARLLEKQHGQNAFLSVVPFKKSSPAVEKNLIALFAAAHRQLIEKFPDCLSKIANTVSGDAEIVITTKPVITAGKIPSYNHGWLYVSAVLSVQRGDAKICQIKSNCAGTVNGETGEKGSCW